MNGKHHPKVMYVFWTHAHYNPNPWILFIGQSMSVKFIEFKSRWIKCVEPLNEVCTAGYMIFMDNSLPQRLISHNEISSSCNENWSYVQVLLTFLQFKHNNS